MARLRRAELARVVRGVVVASALVCVAALARATVEKVSGAPPEVSHAARVSMRGLDTLATFKTVHDAPSPAGQARGRAASKHEGKRGGARATASRAHGG